MLDYRLAPAAPPPDTLRPAAFRCRCLLPALQFPYAFPCDGYTEEWIGVVEETDSRPSKLPLQGSRTHFFRGESDSLNGELLRECISVKLGCLEEVQVDGNSLPKLDSTSSSTREVKLLEGCVLADYSHSRESGFRDSDCRHRIGSLMSRYDCQKSAVFRVMRRDKQMTSTMRAFPYS